MRIPSRIHGTSRLKAAIAGLLLLGLLFGSADFARPRKHRIRSAPITIAQKL